MQTQEQMYRWTIQKYHQMIKAGIFETNNWVELLDGVITPMSAKGIPHVIISRWISDQLREKIGTKAYIITQDSIILIEQNSEPEPDIVIVKGSIFDYREHHPYPEDIELVIEVADSSLGIDKNIKTSIYTQAKIKEYWIIDKNIKTSIYTQAKIKEYWIVDVQEQEIIVHQQPCRDFYEQIQVKKSQDELTVSAFPHVKFLVSELFLEGV
ncbi:Uncharacterized protein conserved in cyanobacteria [Gloeomargarita lithophora Alchichica-D10]|uniref:Uncharacterized protein conserved in cyanobacteria n=1 Tax=Gloeomargarita lithophora Alchichica-D10 TaxID=1188229 RepID=A0A1J0A967_9CYAN|nr:Uma2 family endonuclease [Gloeomargarita lithophora]APB32482.1 Uncharacterized protein conserved in cyanobacteria [Gloeomargarita lithophora Alchichica-D10]